MISKKLIVFTFFFIFSFLTGSIAIAREPSNEDTLSRGLWWLYHLQYDKARGVFDQYAKENPKDPAGYFYKTAVDWWQLAQEFDQELPEIRQRLNENYHKTVQVANALLDSAPDAKTKGLAYLYAGGAEGLMGRWLVTQHQWLKAYFLGKSGYKKLRKALEHDPTLYDAYLGLGIYDYYTDTLGGVQKVLAALFIRGDRERGLQEIQRALDKGRHARVEAVMFLIEIYLYEEFIPAKALPLALQMHQEFPNSPAMYLSLIMVHYEMKQWEQVAKLAQDYLEKSLEERPYYRHEGVNPARYCLGVAALFGRQDLDSCLKYMNDILADGASSSRWVTFAYLRIGQVHDLKGSRPKAMEFYRKVLERPDFWGSHHEARVSLKQPFKY